MKSDRPPFPIVFRAGLQKSWKLAAFSTAMFMVVGWVLEGDRKQLMTAGIFFAIMFASRFIAECWRPSPIVGDQAGDRSRSQP